MFEIEAGLLILLIICLVAACGFEFVNGFHDTANAVATVIYTHSLKPWVAVVWSGICNFAGVMLGGIGVAMGIVNLLPVETLISQDIYQSIAMVMALLLSAIIWNLGTWYYGLPSSSSHTLIGSILGVGLAFSLVSDLPDAGINWQKTVEIMLSLVVSPLFGFGVTIVLMFLIRQLAPGKYKEKLFKEPPKDAPPPAFIRAILILTCTLVSFFHGSNDGQKGVGLVMLILIGIVPTWFALNQELDPMLIQQPLARIEQHLQRVEAAGISPAEKNQLAPIKTKLSVMHDIFAQHPQALPKEKRFDVRAALLVINKEVGKIKATTERVLPAEQQKELLQSLDELKKYTDYAPGWVTLMISLSLGIGTMVGWKRIVKTIGEKIGKEHLTYAQGASAELVAASTIGLSTQFGLPVSTTHVLSSGIAGSMVANGGLGNLQPKTIRNIAMAWLLPLPVSIGLAASLFLLFRTLF